MTLAGTRPILQDELRQYELHHRARIAIKPGITGMWQVSGRSDILLNDFRFYQYVDWALQDGSGVANYVQKSIRLQTSARYL